MDEIEDREGAEKQVLGCVDIYRLDVGKRQQGRLRRGSCEVIVVGQCPGEVIQGGRGSAMPDAAKRLSKTTEENRVCQQGCCG